MKRESSIYGTYSRKALAVGAITTGTKTTIAGTEIHDSLRCLMAVIAGALIILPAYINYEQSHSLILDITASTSISATYSAIRFLLFIQDVSEHTIKRPKKP